MPGGSKLGIGTILKILAILVILVIFAILAILAILVISVKQGEKYFKLEDSV